ncbi:MULTISPECIES: CMD domain-containing protein [Dickeya]|uniref:CMD domain-containing protein n=1 Tax=Dickeya TaxID=204037 RepID=UPI00039FF442|nr:MULTISPECIES: hypothetical protein [Dickeya]UGA49312.1 hypothetical protein QR68_11900 [Dickeya fangzhongdai]UWH05666.1 hypothetical protein K0H75_11900 [Dickeya fangzhongdai]
MNNHNQDAVDRLAGLDPQGELSALRRRRPEWVVGIADCRQSVLTPADERQLPAALRVALAMRMAMRLEHPALTAEYQCRLTRLDTEARWQRVAQGEDVAAPSWLAAVIAHCDKVTLSPERCRQDDLRRLERAGLTPPQVVALSELIAFVNFEVRVIAGLALLETLA